MKGMIQKGEYDFNTLKLCIDSLIAREYITSPDLIKELDDMLKVLRKGNLVAQNVKRLQEINNELYKQHGADDMIIDFQVEINKIRNFYDVPDDSELMKYPDGYFAQ